MPKLKTKKKTAKRMRVTKNGKVIVHASGRRHLLGDKSPKRKRQMRHSVGLTGTVAKNLKAVLPYA